MTLFTFTFIYCAGAGLVFALYAYELYVHIRPRPVGYSSFRAFFNIINLPSTMPIKQNFLTSLDEPAREQIAVFLRRKRMAAIVAVLLFLANVVAHFYSGKS